MLRQAVSLLFGISLTMLVSGGESSAQSISIFGSAVPKNPIDDGNPVTIGVKFWSSQSGTVSGIRFYRAAKSSQGYVAKLYSASGTLLGSVKLARESGPVPGWQVANFASPIPISGNTTYIAAYYSPVGRGAWDEWGLNNGVTNGPLTAPSGPAAGGNGVYRYNNAFPNQSYDASNYYVDVLFTPAARYLVLNINPPNPSIPSTAAVGSVVATILPSWSDGGPFTGTLSFAQPYSNAQGTFAISGSNLIVNPFGPGLSAVGNTVQNVTIVATQ
jgi:Domain of unknown function (DUF4082)